MLKNGLIEENGELVYYKDDIPYHAGVIQENGDFYYIGSGGHAVKGKHTVHTSMTNGLLNAGVYQFGDDYKLVKIDEDKNGFFEEDGGLRFYKKGRPYHAGVVKEGEDIYYVGSGGYAIKGKHAVHTSMANGFLKAGVYQFGDDYKLVKIDEDKNGLFEEDGGLRFYKKGRPYHAGVVKKGKDIYYIGSGGRAVKGTHNIHHEMANRILKRGTYTFGDDYKLIPESYVAPRKKKKKDTKKKRPNSKNIKFALIVAAVVIIIALIDAGLVIAQQIQYKRELENSANNSPTVSEISLPTFDKEVLLCTDAAKKAYDGEITIQQAIAEGNPYRPFVFEYSLIDQDGMLQIGETADLTNVQTYILPYKEKSVSIDNLKTGTTYYYKVTVGDKVYPGSFKTAECIRFISLPGIYNTRDIGGYTTLDGKKVKQGMLIRGTEVDGLGTIGDCYFLADTNTIMQFGFALEMDLRNEVQFSNTYKSRLGDTVLHKQYTSSCYYKAIFTSAGKETVKEIFTDLSNPSNYPIYLHCTYGADRTGTVAFLIQGLLGIDEKQIMDQYRLTGVFRNGFENEKSNSEINGVFGGLEEYDGNTINEKIENYLLSIGVTMEQIKSIRNIFLE